MSKLTILTLLPKYWNIRKTGEEFPDATNCKMCTAKQTVLRQPGRSLSPEVDYFAISISF
jgi:hypothetical protein